MAGMLDLGDQSGDLEQDFPDLEIDRTKKLPWLAAISSDGKTLFLDTYVPELIELSGKKLDPAIPLAHHMVAELEACKEGLRQLNHPPSEEDREVIFYESSINVGQPTEHEWLRDNGYDVGEWEAWISNTLSRIASESLSGMPADVYVQLVPGTGVISGTPPRLMLSGTLVALVKNEGRGPAQDIARVVLDVDRDHDVPWIACLSGDGRTLYIDKNLPKTVTVGDKTFDPAEPLGVHEHEEYRIMRAQAPGMSPAPSNDEREQLYKDAHEQAISAEHGWLQGHGVDIPAWENLIRQHLANVTWPGENPPNDSHVEPIPETENRLMASKAFFDAGPDGSLDDSVLQAFARGEMMEA